MEYFDFFRQKVKICNRFNRGKECRELQVASLKLCLLFYQWFHFALTSAIILAAQVYNDTKSFAISSSYHFLNSSNRQRFSQTSTQESIFIPPSRPFYGRRIHPTIKMVTIKNILLFITAASALTIGGGDTSTILNDISTFDSEIKSLTSAVNSYNSGLFAAASIQRSESALGMNHRIFSSWKDALF
jgi:hypothetical protein